MLLGATKRNRSPRAAIDWDECNAHQQTHLAWRRRSKCAAALLSRGIEALAVESLFAARRVRCGEGSFVFASRDVSAHGWDGALPDLPDQSRRGTRPAPRREMREAAETLRNIGLEPFTALATAERQDWLAQEMAEREISFRAGELSPGNNSLTRLERIPSLKKNRWHMDRQVAQTFHPEGDL